MGRGLFTFEFDIREINKTFDDMSEAYKKAAVNTLNKVGRQVNKAVSKNIKTNYNISATDLKIGDKVKLERADIRKDFIGFTIRVIQSRRGFILYGAQQIIGGVRVEITRQPKIVKGAFISVWKRQQNQKWAFLRDPKLGHYTKNGITRTKRRALFGPSIADLYRSTKARKIMDNVLNENFQKVLNEEFNKQFERR